MWGRQWGIRLGESQSCVGVRNGIKTSGLGVKAGGGWRLLAVRGRGDGVWER